MSTKANFDAFSSSAIADIAASSSSSSAIESVQECAIEAGFERTRYWSISHYRPSSQLMLVLSSFKSSPGIPDRYRLGLSIPAKYAHIEIPHLTWRDDPPATELNSPSHDSQNSHVCVYKYDRLRDERDTHLDTVLGCKGKVVIEVAVHSDWQTLEGVLALETRIGAVSDSVSTTELSSIGKLLGQRIRLDTHSAERILADAHLEGEQALTRVLDLSLRKILDQAGGAVGALFRWNWVEDEIAKIKEYHLTNGSEGLNSPVGNYISESFKPGEKYTGKAWLDRDARHVFDIQGIRGGDPHPDIDLPSLHYHEEILGRVTSVLYGSLVNTNEQEESGGRFLVRLINVRRSSALPFVASNVRSLNHLCSRSSYAIREALTNERLRLLIALADASMTDVSETLRNFGAAVKLEDVTDWLVLLRSPGSNIELEHASKGLMQAELELRTNGRYFHSLLAEDEPTWIQVEGVVALRSLASQGYKSAWVLPFASGSGQGVLLVGSRSEFRGNPRTRRPPGDSEAYLKACVTLLGRSLDAGRSEAMVEGAKKALGFMGHELGTPFMQMHTHSIASTRLAERAGYTSLRARALALRFAPPSERYKLEQSSSLSGAQQKVLENRRAVGEKAAYIASVLRLAPIVALRTDRTLRVQFKQVSIRKLLLDSKERTEDDPVLEARPSTAISTSEFGSEQTTIVQHPWKILLPSHDSSSLRIVCDHYLLVVALSGLLRNAVKFSIPRPGNSTSLIVVKVEPQPALVDFVVTNWGIGIPAGDRRAIFSAFTQGKLLESRRATRGMGLGLYLSSSIAEAHGGRVLLDRSEPVDFNDPKRLRVYEGYETSFRLRVSRQLKEGMSEYSPDLSAHVLED